MAEEMVDVVDEKGKVLKTVTREEADEKKNRMKAAKVLIFHDGKLLIHKRAAEKRNYPNMWDIGMAEVLQTGEESVDGAVRGLTEELGIVTNKSKIGFLFDLRFDSEKTNRLYHVFFYKTKQKIIFDKEEISEIRWISHEEMKNLIKRNDWAPSAKPIYEKYLLMKKDDEE